MKTHPHTHQAHTHAFTMHTTRHSLTAQSLIHIFQPTSCFYRGEKKKCFSPQQFFSPRESQWSVHTKCSFFFLFIFRFACAPSSHNLSTSERGVHHMNDVGTRTLSHCEDCVSCTTHARPNSLHSLLRRGLHVKQ